MAKLAHERVSARRKVKTSEIRELENRLMPGPIMLGFGKSKSKKKRLAELIMTDPGYFYWAYCSGALRRYDPWLDHEAWELIQKAAHIRPPRFRPDAWEFAIYFDRAGRFLDFKIVKKSEKLKPRKGLLRVKHLDLSLVSNLGLSKKDQRACLKLVERIREEFFPDKTLTHWDYQEFFNNDRNLDASCREHHCPKIPRRISDRACRRYDGSNNN